MAVVRSWPTDCIDVNHPATAHVGQRLVDAERVHFPLYIGCTGVVRSFVQPRSHERTVLANNHAVIDDSSVIEKIGKASFGGLMFFESKVFIDLAYLREQKQHQQDAHDRNCDEQ
ncbi:hypothetical protein D3C85_1375390 [compost metagenome]